MDACAFPGCRRALRNGNKPLRGWCEKHYLNWRYHGDPAASMTMREAIESLPDVKLFISQLEVPERHRVFDSPIRGC